MAILVPRRIPHFQKPSNALAIAKSTALSGYLILNRDLDADSYGNNRIINNSGTYRDNKLRFNGIDQRAGLTSPVLGGRTQYSIEWKGKLLGSTGVDHPIYSEYNTSGSPAPLIWFDAIASGSGFSGAGNTNTITFEPGGDTPGSGRIVAPSGTAVQGAEYHIIATFLGGSRVAIYNNGDLLAEKTSGIDAEANASSEQFMAFSGVLSKYGNIETEFLIFWDHALSDTEVVERTERPYSDIFQPRRRWVPVVIQGGVGDTLLSASVNAAGTVSTDLTTEISLDALATASGISVADLTTAITLGSAVNAVGTTVSDLATSISLDAGTSASGAVSADLATEIRFNAAVSATGTISAGLTTAITLDAAVSAAGAVSAQLEAGSAELSASIAASGVTSADFTTAIALDSAVSASGIVSADITTSISLDAGTSAAITSFADLDTQITFAGALTAAGTVTAELAGTGALFEASVSGAITVSGDLLTQIIMQAGISAAGTTNTTLTVGLVVINTSASETLTLSAENPTLTLTP